MITKNNQLNLFKKIARKKLFTYKLYYFSFFFALGTFLPLYPIYLSNVAQISEGLIGIILSINPLLSILFQPIWGLINERFKLDKKIVLMSILVVNIATVMIILSKPITDNTSFITIYSFIIIFATLYGSFVCSIGPIQDSLTVMYAKKYGFKYGDVRIWGSIGYAIAAFLTGKLVTLFSNYNIIIYLSTIFYIISFISFIKVKQVKALQINKSITKESNFISVLNNKVFIIFLVFAALSIGVLSATGQYLFLWIQENGGSEDNIGVATSLLVGIEILVMIIILKFNTRFSDLSLILTSVILQIPVLIIFIITDNKNILIWTLLIRGASQGLFVPVMVNFISSLLPTRQMSTGIILYSAFSIGLTGFLTSIIGGFIIENTSYAFFFKIILFLVIISLTFGIILGKVRKQIIVRL